MPVANPQSSAAHQAAHAPKPCPQTEWVPGKAAYACGDNETRARTNPVRQIRSETVPKSFMLLQPKRET